MEIKSPSDQNGFLSSPDILVFNVNGVTIEKGDSWFEKGNNMLDWQKVSGRKCMQPHPSLTSLIDSFLLNEVTRDLLFLSFLPKSSSSSFVTRDTHSTHSLHPFFLFTRGMKRHVIKRLDEKRKEEKKMIIKWGGEKMITLTTRECLSKLNVCRCTLLDSFTVNLWLRYMVFFTHNQMNWMRKTKNMITDLAVTDKLSRRLTIATKREENKNNKYNVRSKKHQWRWR